MSKLAVVVGQVVGHLLDDVGSLSGLDRVIVNADEQSWKNKQNYIYYLIRKLTIADLMLLVWQ